MSISEFPPVELADPDSGLLAVGGDLEPESLLLAYCNGIFPWPLSRSQPIPWFAPPRRAVLFLEEFRRPKSVRKMEKNRSFQLSIDRDFPAVINGCAETHQRKGGTWITPEMVNAYIKLHKAGFAHSIECSDDTGLVGGLYGVSIGRMFAGESMFYRSSGASKAALCFLVDILKEKNVTWIDCQQLTPLLTQFGAREISRKEFMKLLRKAVDSEQSLFQTQNSL